MTDTTMTDTTDTTATEAPRLHVGAVTFDTTGSAAALADFWSNALDRPVPVFSSSAVAGPGVDRADTAVAMIDGVGGAPALMFLRVPDRTAGKNSVHLDLIDPDYPAQVDRLVALGATRLGDFDEWGIAWTTLTDPEGNVFDVARVHG